MLALYIDERTGVFGAQTDDYFVRLLMQQFAKILGLFVEKPKLAAAVQDAGGAPLLRWLGSSACPALGTAAFGSASPHSHRIEFMRALTMVLAVEGVALSAGREGLVGYTYPLEELVACIVSLDEDQLVCATATELLLGTLRHPSRAPRSVHAARLIAASATTRNAFAMVCQLGGLGDPEALSALQTRCTAHARVAAEVLGALCDAIGDLGGGSGIDPRRDCEAICTILRVAGSRPGPSAEEGVPCAQSVESAGAVRFEAAVTAMDLFRAVLGRCPDKPEYLRCLLEPDTVSVETIELLSTHGASIPPQLWSEIVLPFVAQELNRACRARWHQSVAGSTTGGPTLNAVYVQEITLLVRDCSMMFYPLGQSAARGSSPGLGVLLFRCLLSAMHAGFNQTERFAECAAQVCAIHLGQGASQWLVDMLSSKDEAPVGVALTSQDQHEVNTWGLTAAAAVTLALLGLDGGDGTGASGTQVTIDQTQIAAVLSACVEAPISHKTLHLFTILGRDYRVLAPHADAIGALLSNIERWISDLVVRLSASAAPPSYALVGQLGGDSNGAIASSPVVIAALDLDMLRCVMETLRVLVPHLQPTNALLLFDLALKVLALLPTEEVTGYTDAMLEAVIRCIAQGGGVARISAAALSQACTVSGVQTRGLLAQLLPEHMLSDPSPLVRAEALRTLGLSASPERVQLCGHIVLSASIARADGSDSDNAGGSNRVDEVLRLLHLDVKEAEFEVEQLQLAIAAAPCLAEVAQLPGELGRQAAQRLAAFSRLSRFSDPMREPHPTIAEAEQRIPGAHQSIYSTEDRNRLGVARPPPADEMGPAGVELTEMQPAAATAATVSADVVFATAVEPVAGAQLNSGDAAASLPVLQAVVVQDADASWQEIQKLATARYVVEGGKDQDPDDTGGTGMCAGRQEKFANPAHK